MTSGSKSKTTNRRTSDKQPEAPPVSDDTRIPGRKLTADDESRLIQVTGFTRKQLYNRRGWHSERGVATMLEAGDTIESIDENHVVIRTAAGTVQTVYNLEKETPFLKRLRR